MTDKRLVGGAIPWSGGLSRIVRPMLVPDTDMTTARNVHITLDGIKRKRAGSLDLYGTIYTAASESVAF